MKKLVHFLNIIMVCVAGLYMGYSIFILWNRIANPGLYAYYSAPWYTGILLYGVMALAGLVVCTVIKAILKHCIKKSEGKLAR